VEGQNFGVRVVNRTPFLGCHGETKGVHNIIIRTPSWMG
jgi:hypothetical protein